MIAHRIRPQTTNPTARAAIHDPCHRATISFPCVVSGFRRPKFTKRPASQPLVIVTKPTTRALIGSQRRGNRALSPWRAARCSEARGVGLTDGLPSNKSRRQRPVMVDVLQPVVETVQRLGGTASSTPASDPNFWVHGLRRRRSRADTGG